MSTKNTLAEVENLISNKIKEIRINIKSSEYQKMKVALQKAGYILNENNLTAVEKNGTSTHLNIEIWVNSSFSKREPSKPLLTNTSNRTETNFELMRNILSRIVNSWERTGKEFPSGQKLLAHKNFHDLRNHINNCLDATAAKGKFISENGLPSLESFVIIFSDEFGEEMSEKAIKNIAA